jgi:dTDP-4-amino-4,6-dideoxygalactose transaminase
MWVRKEIEISPLDLVRGLGYCFSTTAREKLARRIADRFGGEQVVTCLSVRSGFDSLLRSLNWSPQSEVILSGLTIPDMPRIVREQGHRPIGADLHIDSLAPDIEL